MSTLGRATIIFLSLISLCFAQSYGPDGTSSLGSFDDSPSMDLQESMELMQLSNSLLSDPQAFQGEQMEENLKRLAKLLQGQLKRSNPFRLMPESVLENMIAQGLKERVPGADENHPAVKRLVTLLRDTDSLVAAIGIIDRVDDMRTFGIIALIISIVSLIAGFVLTKSMGIFQRILVEIGVLLAGGLMSLGIFYFIFQDNLRPIVTVLIG